MERKISAGGVLCDGDLLNCGVDHVDLVVLDVLVLHNLRRVLIVDVQVDPVAEVTDLLPSEDLRSEICRVLIAFDLVDYKEPPLDQVLDVQRADLEVLHLPNAVARSH